MHEPRLVGSSQVRADPQRATARHGLDITGGDGLLVRRKGGCAQAHRPPSHSPVPPRGQSNRALLPLRRPATVLRALRETRSTTLRGRRNEGLAWRVMVRTGGAGQRRERAQIRAIGELRTARRRRPRDARGVADAPPARLWAPSGTRVAWTAGSSRRRFLGSVASWGPGLPASRRAARRVSTQALATRCGSTAQKAVRVRVFRSRRDPAGNRPSSSHR